MEQEHWWQTQIMQSHHLLDGMIQMDLQGQNILSQGETTLMPMRMETTQDIAQMEALVYYLISLLTKPTLTLIKAKMLSLPIYFTGIILSMM